MRLNPIALLYLAAAGFGAAMVYQVVVNKEAIGAAAGAVLDSINPTNPDNVAATAVNSVVRAATGDSQATLGTKLWEWVNPGQAAQDAKIADPVKIEKPAPGSGNGAAPDLGAVNFDPPSSFFFGAP